MKLSIQKNLTQHIMSATAIACIAIPASIVFSGAAYAVECAPLQVSGFEIVQPKKIVRGGKPVGVEFYVRTTVKNTNLRVPVPFHRQTQATSFLSKTYVTSGERKTVETGRTNFSTSLRPGYIGKLTSKKMSVMRDPGNLTQLNVILRGHVNNALCPPGKRTSRSEFKYDLQQVLTGGKPRRVSGRIAGYSEGPRPRPGTGAPRPRS